MKKKWIMVLGFLLLFDMAGAQLLNPVKWSYVARKISATEAVLYLKATIDHGWHVYSVNQKDGGPLKTSFTFEPNAGYAVAGKVTEPKPISKFEEVYGIQVDYFENEVVFQQKIRLKKPNVIIKGKIQYMACTDEQCTPPLAVKFSTPIK